MVKAELLFLNSYGPWGIRNATALQQLTIGAQGPTHEVRLCSELEEG